MATLCWSCSDSIQDSKNDNGGQADDFTNLLTNQVDSVIIPTFESYQVAMANLKNDVQAFIGSINEQNLSQLKSSLSGAYMAYQHAAVHNYNVAVNENLVKTSNLFPVDKVVIDSLIENKSYDFNNISSDQRKANGFPALDYMLYSSDDVLTYFQSNSKRGEFIIALVTAMDEKATKMANTWKNTLRMDFIDNPGTALGSSVSNQLNKSLTYYEDRVREDKVGIPIGRLGPNDTPIDPDSTKIESYHRSQADGHEGFSLMLVRAAVQEMEKIYLGKSASAVDGQGYDDLLKVGGKSDINEDIKDQFETIYNIIGDRTSISGSTDLYDAVQKNCDFV